MSPCISTSSDGSNLYCGFRVTLRCATPHIDLIPLKGKDWRAPWCAEITRLSGCAPRHPGNPLSAEPSRAPPQALMTEELLPRAMHLCYGNDWSSRLAGVRALQLLTEKCGTSTFSTTQIGCQYVNTQSLLI